MSAVHCQTTTPTRYCYYNSAIFSPRSKSYPDLLVLPESQTTRRHRPPDQLFRHSLTPTYTHASAPLLVTKHSQRPTNVQRLRRRSPVKSVLEYTAPNTDTSVRYGDESVDTSLDRKVDNQCHTDLDVNAINMSLLSSPPPPYRAQLSVDLDRDHPIFALLQRDIATRRIPPSPSSGTSSRHSSARNSMIDIETIDAMFDISDDRKAQRFCTSPLASPNGRTLRPLILSSLQSISSSASLRHSLALARRRVGSSTSVQALPILTVGAYRPIGVNFEPQTIPGRVVHDFTCLLWVALEYVEWLIILIYRVFLGFRYGHRFTVETRKRVKRKRYYI